MIHIRYTTYTAADRVVEGRDARPEAREERDVGVLEHVYKCYQI